MNFLLRDDEQDSEEQALLIGISDRRAPSVTAGNEIGNKVGQAEQPHANSDDEGELFGINYADAPTMAAGNGQEQDNGASPLNQEGNRFPSTDTNLMFFVPSSSDSDNEDNAEQDRPTRMQMAFRVDRGELVAAATQQQQQLQANPAALRTEGNFEVVRPAQRAPAVGGATQVAGSQNPNRKRSRTTLGLLSSTEVHAEFQRHWKAAQAKRQPFCDVIASLLTTEQERRRHASLVNISNWEAADARNDILLPQQLIAPEEVDAQPNPESQQQGRQQLQEENAGEPAQGERNREADVKQEEGRAVEAAPAVHPRARNQKYLKSHQVDGIRFAWSQLVEGPTTQVPAVGCILAHSMGLGKSCQVILFVHLFWKLLAKKATILIVAPKSAKASWESEFTEWSHYFPLEDRAPVYIVDERMRKDTRVETVGMWSEVGGILLIGYEALVALQREERNGAGVAAAGAGEWLTFSAEHPTDLLVCDEAHRIKSSGLDIVRALSRTHAARRLLLTGTPMQNHLLEYWSMVDFAMPKYFDRRSFLSYFVRPIQRSMEQDASPQDVLLARKRTFALVKEFSQFVQRVAADPLRRELPPLHEFVVTVPLSPLQEDLYRKLLAILQAERSERLNFLQAFSYAAKICAHPQMLFDFKVPVTANNSGGNAAATAAAERYTALCKAPQGYVPKPEEGHKLVVAIRIILSAKELGERTLVFSMSTQLLDWFEKMLAAVGEQQFGTTNKIGFVRIDGSTSFAERSEKIQTFQSTTRRNSSSNAGIDVFLLSTKAGGIGITLTAATRVILLDCSFNPADDRQAIGRAYRYGQTKPVFVYRLVCGNTIEHRVFDQKIGKDWLFKTVVDDQVVKRDALSGLKLKEIFLMTDTSPVSERMRAVTDRCIQDDPLLRPLRAWVLAVAKHDSLLEDDENEYGAEERRFYEQYLKKGGVWAIAEQQAQQVKDPEAERRERAERVEVACQAHSLTRVINNILESRANASPHARELFAKFGVHVAPLNPQQRRRTATTGAPAAAAAAAIDLDDDAEIVVDDTEPVVVVREATPSSRIRPLVSPHQYAPFRKKGNTADDAIELE